MESLKLVFNQEFMNRLEQMSIYYKSKPHLGFQGMRKSLQKGSSLEFSDYKEYRTGDDLRKIDWNTYARLDRLFIKLFEEEKPANIHIFLDISKSMDYGEPNKGFYSKLVVLSLCYMGLSRLDKIRVFFFNNGVKEMQFRLSNKQMLLGMIGYLEDVLYENEADMELVKENIEGLKLYQGKSFVISDYLFENPEKLLKSLRYKKQDVACLHILSPSEVNPEYSGEIRLMDMENSEAIDVDADYDLMEQYKAQLKSFLLDMEKRCVENRGEYIFQPTDSDILNLLKGVSSVY